MDADEMSRDVSARAILDHERVRVVMPITPYLFDYDVWRKIRIAQVLLSRDCMEARGFVVEIPEPVSQVEMRIWGLWSIGRAERYGFGFPGDEQLVEPSAAYLAAEQDCAGPTSERLERLLGADPTAIEDLANQIIFQAHDAASKTATYRELRAAYDDCLREAGRIPDNDPSHWGIRSDRESMSVGPAQASSADIQTAVTEARCNVRLNVTQIMGDLEASYQAPLIAKNRAALNVNRSRIVDVENRLDEFIRLNQ
ncbi:MAG: hypothetical protein Q4F67_07070 [Propionibacteriaceae bacterium]|nr:hypothetical protein [Propionibacteriaceae bacterium]